MPTHIFREQAYGCQVSPWKCDLPAVGVTRESQRDSMSCCSLERGWAVG
jgi:hypothetical protein